MIPWGPGAGHPALLPWYVAGRLSGREAQRVRAHVVRCADCRERVGELAVQRALLLGGTRTDHPTVEELVFAEPDPALPAHRREAVSLHVAGCPACAHEYALLAESSERLAAAAAPERASPRPGATVPWGRWAAAAAASIVLVAAGFLAGRARQTPAPGVRAIAVATLLPPHRGGAPESVLTLPGPWAVTAALPRRPGGAAPSQHLTAGGERLQAMRRPPSPIGRGACIHLAAVPGGGTTSWCSSRA
jgi:anti-sigma factor RsiW